MESVRDSTSAPAHGSGCACGDCPHGAREGHRRAVAAFVAQRDGLAAGVGVPAALAHSAGASRQWVSDELTHSARQVADGGRAAGEAWLRGVWRGTLLVVWGGAVALLLAATATAVGAGWSPARTAALLATLALGVLLTVAARLHRARGGLLAPLIGEDNRLSTSRAVAAAWVLLAVFTVLVLACELTLAGGQDRRRALIDGLRLGQGAGVLTSFAVVCAVAVIARRVVTVRVRSQRLQKVRAERSHARDLLTDDAGRGSFSDAQYVLIATAVVVFALARLGRQPDRLPDVPWGLTLLLVVSALTYLAGKWAEGGRPVVLSVVRARELGDLDGPIRPGDDIEIRGAGFVPPGAQTPDALARMVVRLGAVHVHVPLVPVPGGFVNPTDTALTVPVPAEVEPGRVEVQVVTASGAETNRYAIEVVD
ncbi:hypothetical protein [Streptomyces sp. URMC 123]|uniref:hypothetical protein n=1 Tax=Streptomyces sp. URMC 123 TaxID=3423403 RepID=UPI003F1B760F